MNSLYSPSASWSIFREIEVILLIKYPIEIAAIKRPSLLDERPYDSDRRVEKEAECSGKIINCTRENAFSHYSFPTLLLSLSHIAFNVDVLRCYFFNPFLPPSKAVKCAGLVLNWALICCAHVYPSVLLSHSLFSELIS